MSSAQGDVAAWMADNTRLLKSDTGSVVGLLQLERGLCCLKLYRYQSALRRGLLQFGYGRPTRSFDIGSTMAAAGLPVPRPLACLRVAQGGLLLTEGVADARDLQALWRAGPDEPRRWEYIQGSAELLVRLYKAACVHGDCKWSNLLWDGKRWWLVDLDAAMTTSSGGDRLMRDLARYILNAEEMGVAADEFELFMTHYLRGTGQSRGQVISQVKPLLRKFRARHLARYGPRGTPLL